MHAFYTSNSLLTEKGCKSHRYFLPVFWLLLLFCTSPASAKGQACPVATGVLLVSVKLPAKAAEDLAIPAPTQNHAPVPRKPVTTGEIIFTIALVTLTVLAFIYLFTLFAGVNMVSYAWPKGIQVVLRVVGVIGIGSLILFAGTRIFERPERRARRQARRTARRNGQRINKVEILF